MDILLLPGLWLDGEAWRAVLPGIEAAGHRPVPFTLPGQGDGAPHATLDDQLAAVLTAIDEAEGPVYVVAHSGACTLAWLAADRRPDRVAGVAMVGGMPSSEGEPYFGHIPPTDGYLAFPGWEAFEGPDSDDLTDDMREAFAAHSHLVPAEVVTAPVHYTDPARHRIPVTLVCPEFSPDDARGWLEAGQMPELEAVERLSLVDLSSGHWPMFSQPEALARVLVAAAESTGGDQPPPWEPPFAGSESEHLFGMLDRLRATFRWKADGLDDAGLRARIPTSELSIGVLLKHLAMCEDDIFAWKINGQRPEARF